MCREMGRTDAAGRLSPLGRHPHRALCPVVIDCLSCPSQLSCRGGVREAGIPPCTPAPSPVAASLPPAEICLLLRWRSWALEWSPRRHAIREEWRELCPQRGGGPFAGVPAPSPSRLAPASKDSPMGAGLLRTSAGTGVSLVPNLAPEDSALQHPLVLGPCPVPCPRERACAGRRR